MVRAGTGTGGGPGLQAGRASTTVKTGTDFLNGNTFTHACFKTDKFDLKKCENCDQS